MSRLYIVSFDTQRDRVYRNWEYITSESSKAKAIEQARANWQLRYYENNHRSDPPHMFHCYAEMVEAVPDGRKLDIFKCVDWRPVTWGRR